MKHITAVYPGTFDPLTHGHTDIVQRAARLFDHVIVAIAENQSKKPWLTIDKRVALAKSLLKNIPNISVESFDGLLVDFARDKKADVIVRGIRAVSDFDYEFQLAGMNRKMAPSIETIFLTPAEQHACISASLVREIKRMGGNIEAFVAKEAIAAMEEK